MNWIPKIVYTDRVTAVETTLTFDSPPEGDPFNEKYTDSKTVTRSNNGTPQTQFNYTLKEFKLDFKFQSEAVKDAFLAFRETAKYGIEFDYYPSSDEVEFETFTINDRGFSLKRPIPGAVEGEFEYDFTLRIDRVL